MSSKSLIFSKIFDSFSRLSLDGIWIVDTQGRLLEANEVYGKLVGYSRTELLGMSIKDLEAEETPQEILQTIAKIKKEGVARFERTHRRRDGVLVPVEISSTFFEMDQEQFFLVFIRDLSLMKVVQKESAFNTALLSLSAQKTSLQEYVDAVVAHIRDWCGCQSVGLGLGQDPIGTLKFVALAGSSHGNATCGGLAEADSGHCLCFRLLHGKPETHEAPYLTPEGSFYCDNVPRFIAGLPKRQQAKYRATCLDLNLMSLAIVPLHYHESSLGVILLAGGQDGPVPLSAVQFLETMAPLVAEGIARHSMEAELKLNLHKQGVINALLSLALEDLPLQEILQRSLELLTDIPFMALEPKGSISLVEAEPDKLVMRAQKGLPEPILQSCAQIPFGRCVCGRTAATRQLQFVARSDVDHEVGYPDMPLHGHYCLPILHGERVLGVLNLYVKAGQRCTGAEEDFLLVAAQTLAGIIMRLEAEEARRRSDQELTLLVGNIPAIVCKGYIEGYASFSDNKVEAMLGYPREDLDQRRIKWTDLILQEDLGQARRVFIRALKGNKSYVREYRMRCRTGGIIWVQERSQIVLNVQGKIDYISGVLFDISKRKQGEEALRQEKETAQRYLDIAPVIFTVFDKTGTITLVNKKGCEILGYSEEEIIGRNFADFLPATIKALQVPLFQRWMSGELDPAEYYEAPTLSKTGEERIIGWRNTTLRNPANKIIGGLAAGEDVTGRRRAEQALKESFAQLHRTLEGTVTALAAAVETRDPYTAGHQRGVAQLACAIAAEMGFSPDRLEGIRVMGFLHDIGKIAIPAEILSKPGKLSEYEFNIVKFHSQVSYDILKEVDFPWPVAQAVLQHHEKLDGSGYPHGLQGDDIILEARILTVSDVVEAMASHRPYRPALGIDLAIQEITGKQGILYDPAVVEACLTVLREKRVEF